jgi:LmbE family N-acetylglucosaminyl deacetylase
MSSAGDFQRSWQTLPQGSLDDIIGRGTCVILAPHPDDESLGCGGLIATCVASGRLPLVAVLTDGAKSHPNSLEYPPDRLRAVRAQEVRTAVECLGLPATRVIFLGEPDTGGPRAGPGLDAVVGRLTDLIDREASCTAILAPWRHDPHCDHEAAAVAAAAASHIAGVRNVGYPVWGWTLPADTPLPAPVTAGWRLDISAFLAGKRRAIQAHRTQYGGLITDDPTGFQIPPALLSVFDRPFETFLSL